MNLKQIGQISLTVDNVNTAEHFYEETLGLQKLYRFGNLVFFLFPLSRQRSESIKRLLKLFSFYTHVIDQGFLNLYFHVI